MLLEDQGLPVPRDVCFDQRGVTEVFLKPVPGREPRWRSLRSFIGSDLDVSLVFYSPGVRAPGRYLGAWEIRSGVLFFIKAGSVGKLGF